MNKKKGYANMAMREGEMTTCILNEGALIYNKENDSISVESELRIDDIVELDMKTDNTYDPYNIPFARKCTQPSVSCMGLIVSQPLWQFFPSESKTIREWTELRSNRYYRFAVVYLLRPIAVINNRYVLTSEILKELKVREKEKEEPIKKMEVRCPFVFYKEKYSGLLTITKGDMGVAIDIWNPQPASKENDNISDADFAQKILEKWDNEPVFSLRGNMKLIPTNGKCE